MARGVRGIADQFVRFVVQCGKMIGEWQTWVDTVEKVSAKKLWNSNLKR